MHHLLRLFSKHTPEGVKKNCDSSFLILAFKAGATNSQNVSVAVLWGRLRARLRQQERFICMNWKEKNLVSAPCIYTKEDTEKITHAHLYLSKTRRFVETRSDAQMGRHVLPEHIVRPQKQTQDAHQQASHAANHFKHVANLRLRLAGGVLHIQVCQAALSRGGNNSLVPRKFSSKGW